jgi:hypothetical protein
LFSTQIVIAQEPCTADFNCDQNVDATDVDTFLGQFGRNPFNDPCPDCYDSQCPCTAPGCDPPAPVEKTGQTTSYATGDDGDHEKGVEWPNPRFTDNGDGTVTDNLTGLIWLKDANCFGLRTWDNALSDSNGLASGSCGLTDGSSAGQWRLPNYKELFSLIDASNSTPALPTGHPFFEVLNDYYWTSSTFAHVSDFALYIQMGVVIVSSGNKIDINNVWPVRGGQ